MPSSMPTTCGPWSMDERTGRIEAVSQPGEMKTAETGNGEAVGRFEGALTSSQAAGPQGQPWSRPTGCQIDYIRGEAPDFRRMHRRGRPLQLPVPLSSGRSILPRSLTIGASCPRTRPPMPGPTMVENVFGSGYNFGPRASWEELP